MLYMGYEMEAPITPAKHVGVCPVCLVLVTHGGRRLTCPEYARVSYENALRMWRRDCEDTRKGMAT